MANLTQYSVSSQEYRLKHCLNALQIGGILMQKRSENKRVWNFKYISGICTFT